MSAPIVKGWCPGALRPMMSGDGLVVRIRPPLGRLSQKQAVGIATAAETFGNGLIDLSSRANLQIRGVSETDHAALVTTLQGLGVVDGDPQIEARRNVTVTPFWQDGDPILGLAQALQTALADDDAPQTPGKFGYAIDCGPTPVLTQTAADIRIERDASGKLIVRPDGAMFGAVVTAETAVPVALDLARWFLNTGGASGNRGRMARHIATGALLPSLFAHPVTLPDAFKADPGQINFGTMVALEFGQISASQLARLADLGPLRMTPWRMILVENCTVPINIDGVHTSADTPCLRVSACTGAPGCPQALSPIRETAQKIAPCVATDQSVHISGCSKGCAHPQSAEITLVATGTNTFNLIRNGLASDQPDITGLTLSDLPDHIKNRGI
ncbi:precorrin-3B synthase [uncultured Pelagimonas sp.]|uniref:precorrin-3B synthase n=1 Tax=uncultured Pelagimonas sp. TaxID=1618102 RepID=UPI00260BBD37|nr:precorrin-3B synthase [uncultured Pelagimonas sp.]